MKHGPWGPEGSAALLDRVRSLGVSCSPGQAQSLLAFESLLRERAVSLGLVARSDAGRLLERHVLDSLRAAPVIRSVERDVADIGSGAGLPGIPVAIVRPDLRVSLVEARRRAAAFLELAVERLSLENVEVVAGRVEQLDREFDVCLARAFGPLDRTWRAVAGILRPSGRLVYFGGRRFRPPRSPEGAVVRVLETAVLESGGPLVIMSRQ